MARKSGSVWSMLNAVGNALMIAATEGNAVKAARIHGALEAAWERMEMSLPSDARRILEPYIAAARTQLGDVVFEKAWEAGRDLSLDDAIAYALEERVGSRVTHCRCAAPYRMHLGSRWQVEACAFGEGRDL
jgi:hypothetical protein